MNTFKLNITIYFIVLSTIWLACYNKNVYAETNIAATVAKTEKSILPKHLGLYSGTFKPTSEYIKAEKAFYKWHETSSEGGDGGYSDIDDIPKQLRAYMYKDPLYGTYNFISPNRISVVIDQINDDHTFKAHSIAAGNLRPVLGTWTKENTSLHLIGKEPGDDVTDGTFDMLFNTNVNQINGEWTPNNTKAPSKKFTLNKTTFKYNPKFGEEVDLGRAEFSKNPSTQTLRSKDVENLTQPQIRIIINLIHARHGYSFANQDVRRTFESQDWYIPRSNDIKAELTEMEKKNLMLLKQYSKYADKHYDSFGR